MNAELISGYNAANVEGGISKWALSWAEAKKEASRWLGTLALGRKLHGQTVDLRPHASSLPENEMFRRMVLDAVSRKLKKRGAKEVILPPTESAE